MFLQTRKYTHIYKIMMDFLKFKHSLAVIYNLCATLSDRWLAISHWQPAMLPNDLVHNTTPHTHSLAFLENT